MAYSEFDLPTALDKFGLTLIEASDAFAAVPPLPALTPGFRQLLAEYVPLAQTMNTEKARSELIVMHVLVEVRRQLDGAIGIFSGAQFDVDRAVGLNGFCDFLLSLTPQQSVIRAPVVALVEAKNGDIAGGWGQCLAEMVAAQRFNAARGNSLPRIYGSVTTGTQWLFGVLDDKTATVDYHEYAIDEPERICGIISAMARQAI